MHVRLEWTLLCSATGQEAVWAAVLAQFNVSEADLQDWFTGPAFLAWFRMGNIEGASPHNKPIGPHLTHSYTHTPPNFTPPPCLAPVLPLSWPVFTSFSAEDTLSFVHARNIANKKCPNTTIMRTRAHTNPHMFSFFIH